MSQSVGDMENLEHTHPYLHSRIQIGNSKGPIQYELKQTVFHHDDVPEHKRKRKEEVKEYARRKILDNSALWNISNKPNKPIMERRTMENHVKDRSHQFQYNYRAETLDPLKNIEPLDKSTKFHISVQLESTAKEIMNLRKGNPLYRGQFHRTQEVPNHPDLERSVPWNNGIVLTNKDLTVGLEKKTKNALEWTGKVNQTLTQRKEYISPMMSTKLLGEKVRQKKFEGTFSWKELINKPPTPPEEVFEIKNRELNEGMRKMKVHLHSGTWGPNNVDGRSMWSDTASYVYNSKGDVIKGINMDRSNNIDPVKSSRREEPSTIRQPPSHYSTRPSTRGNSREFDTGNNSMTLSKMNRAETV